MIALLIVLSTFHFVFCQRNFSRKLHCSNANESAYFESPCHWSSDLAFSNKTGLCNPYIIERNFSTTLNGRNFYLLGNSVIRHYSFNIKYLLDEYIGIKENKLNREEEKLKCGALLDVNSCTHFINNIRTTIKFLWMNTIGEAPDRTDKRDICSIANTTTEICLRNIFENATMKDVLILSSSLVNSTSYAGSDMSWINYFANIIKSQESFQIGHLSAHKTLDMLLSVFPGAIIWLPYPFIGTNESVEQVNTFLRAAIETYCSERLIFLNTYSLLKDHKHLYLDGIHHPGKLSDMVVKAIFSLLKQLDI